MTVSSAPLLNLLSGYRPKNEWTFTRTPRPTYSRSLGLVELKFDLASSDSGQSDTFIQLNLTPSDTAHSSHQTLLARLPLAWARLRAIHPALACRVEDDPEPASEDALREGYVNLRRRRFVYEPPPSEEEALARALECVVVEKVGGRAMAEVVDEVVVNGPRIAVDFDCLCRLLVFSGEAGGCGLVLAVSHTISDGLSVLNLVAELLRLLSDADLPTPATTASFASVADLLAGQPTIADWELPAYILTPWQLIVPSADIPALLSPASEDLYPILPFTSPAVGTATAAVPPLGDNPAPAAPEPTAQPAHSSPARQRWLWIISRVVEQVRNARYPISPKFPRLSLEGPPPQAHTRWPTLRLSRELSAALLALCQREKLSPSMLLFALFGLTTASLLSREKAVEDLDDVVFGFPFSLRPCLTGDDGTEQPSRAIDLAIRIGFDCIHLPGLVPASAGGGREDRARTRLLAVRGARLAKEQFRRRLDPQPDRRTRLMCSQYYLILDRMLNAMKSNKIPLNGPVGALNCSMIGDVDRILPSTFALPQTATSSASTLQLTDLIIGTRLHRGEGMLVECFTFGGRITVCLGWDERTVAKETVQGILREVERLAEEVAAES